MRFVGSKKCLNCQTRTSWVRLYLKSWTNAHWPCPHCGMLLRFNPIRRAIIAVLLVILIALLFFLGDRFLLLYIVLVVCISLIEEIIPAEDASSRSKERKRAEQNGGADA